MESFFLSSPASHPHTSGGLFFPAIEQVVFFPLSVDLLVPLSQREAFIRLQLCGAAHTNSLIFRLLCRTISPPPRCTPSLCVLAVLWTSGVSGNVGAWDGTSARSPPTLSNTSMRDRSARAPLSHVIVINIHKDEVCGKRGKVVVHAACRFKPPKVTSCDYLTSIE